MTPDVFMRQAMERPLSPWSTFAGAAREGLLQSPGLGTALREGYAPDSARSISGVKLLEFGKPVKPGDANTFFDFNYETKEQVEARGDKLFETEDAFKASPMYREEIPFEKGMTESRARALAEMHDASTVRNYYSSKRPVVAFAGTIAGAALDPINYIPIVGEAAMAAAVARTGRIAGRALMGGVDAAANTALFGVLSADTRARLGDDVSWQALASNAAFAAMAGVAIGGAIGGVSKFRGWDADMVKPKLEAPPADLPNSVMAKPNSVLDAANSVLDATSNRVSPLSMDGTATAKFTPDRAVTVADVVSRMETAGNRIKAADVLNDAVFGMVNDGDVRLGERSQGHVEAMQTASREAIDKEVSKQQVDFNDLVLRAKQSLAEKESLSTELSASGEPVKFVSVDGKKALAGPDMSAPGKYRLTYFDESGVPSGHTEFDSLKQATRRALDEKYKPDAPRAAPRQIPADSILDTGGTATASSRPAIGGGVQEINYSSPAPDLPPANLKTAETKVDARKTLPADPEQAALDRAIADAKEEGFDPETGKHDLEPDVDSLRAQEALTADEEQALAAADETFQAVEAWQKVMAVAQSCVLK